MGYEDAPATKMLATHCVACGRALVDATSVSVGMGPECRDGWNGGIDEATRVRANKAVFKAALAAQAGAAYEVIRLAGEIRSLGLNALADKVERRFKGSDAMKPAIEIIKRGDTLEVKTPFRRSEKQEFIRAWRAIPGRRYSDGRNHVPASERGAVWLLLKRFFPGKWGRGPRGSFRVPSN